MNAEHRRTIRAIVALEAENAKLRAALAGAHDLLTVVRHHGCGGKVEMLTSEPGFPDVWRVVNPQWAPNRRYRIAGTKEAGRENA